MNAKQEAKLTMGKGVEQHLDTNSAIIAAVPALVTAVSELKTIIANIVGTTQLKDVNLAGIAIDKTVSKQTLAQKTADIAGFIYAFAAATDNNTLQQEVNYNLSKLLKTRDEQLAPRCQIIHDKGIEFKTQLADYGITDATLADLQAAIDSYSATSPKTRTAISTRKTLKSNLAEEFRQLDAVLKKRIDKLINIFRDSHPDFVKTYESNRIIPDPPTTTTQLKGIVTNSADGTPIKGATVTIVELGKIAKTDSAGKYQFKPAILGTYTIRITATGFQDFEDDEVEIKMGTVNSLNVGLSPIDI